MKKLLLMLLAVVLCVGASVAQRRTATESTTIGTADGTITYSYILRDGERIYDGPLTVKATQDESNKIWMYGGYHWMYTERNYSLSANYSNDLLNGPIKMNDEISIQWSGESPQITKRSFTGSFVRGIPNGRFLLDSKVTKKDGTKFSSVYVNVTYKMGVFTGAFSFKDFYYYEDAFSNSPRCEITGSFTNSGEMNGNWYIYSSNDGNSTENTYQFVNGVLVGGGSSSLSAKETALATKYANGQITQKELNDNGLLAIEVRFDAYNYKNRDEANLYEDVRKCISTSIFYDLPDAEYLLNSYENVRHIPYFTDDSFETVFKDIQQDLRTKQSYQNIDSLLKKYEDSNLYCMEFCYWSMPYSCTAENGWAYKDDGYGDKYWRYFLSDSQLKRVKDLVESHNLAIDQKKMETYIPQIKSDYLDGVGKEITINNKLHDVVAVRMVSLDRNTGMMSVEIDSREYEQYIMGNYILVTHKADYDGTKFQNLVPIRNKYNDIVDAKAAFNKEAESQLDKVNTLIKEKQANYLNGVTNQLTIFRNYVAQIDGTQIDHYDLDDTIQVFKEQTEEIKSFSEYMPQYIEAYKLNEQIKQKQIAKYTSTPIPVVANWGKDAKAEMLTETIVAQQNVLKLWEQFSPLKAQVTEAHKQFGSSTDHVLSKYNSAYAALVNSKPTLEAGIEAYTKFIEEQKVVAEQWQKYSTLKAQAEKTHEQIGASDDAVLAAYKTLYNATASKTVLAEAIKAYTKLIEEQKVVAEQWQKYSALKAQAEKAHEQIGASDDTVLAAYKTLYNATASKTVLAEAIEAYTKLIEEQKVVVEQWNTYSDLKWQLTDIHKQLSASNVPVLGTYSSWYDANFKPQTSLENGIATYTKLVAVQKSANEYIPLYNKVVENNTLLASALKPAKCAAKAYKLYYQSLDLNWKAEGAVEHVSEVLKKQMLLLEISKFPTLKEDEKRVEKLKLTNLDDIIKAYIDNKTVAEPQVEVKAAFAVSPKPIEVATVKAEPKEERSKVKVATAKTDKKVEAVPGAKAEKKPHNQPLTAIKSGFGQYVEVSPMLNMSQEGGSFSFNFNYIGGYRFNKNIFLGLGTGLNLNEGQNDWTEFYYNNYGGYGDYYDYYNASLYLLSVPAYLHFRVDWGKRATKWNFYSAFSTGAQFGVYEPYSRFERNYLKNSPLTPEWFFSDGNGYQLYDMYRFNGEILFGLDLGANYRLTDKMSLYMGVGFKYGMRTSSIRIHSYRDRYNHWVVGGPELYDMGFGNNIPSIKVTIGLSF